MNIFLNKKYKEKAQKFIFIIILMVTTTLSAQESTDLKYLPKIDSSFQIPYVSDTLKQCDDLILTNEKLHSKLIIFLSNQDSSYHNFYQENFYQSKFSDCNFFVLAYIDLFDNYIITIDSNINIIDVELIGKSTPPIYSSKKGTGKYVSVSFKFKDCDIIESKIEDIFIKNGKEKIKKVEISTYFINELGMIIKK